MSMAMDIRELADIAASANAYNGDGVNADTLSASQAILGASWTAQVSIGHPHGAGGLVSIRVRTTSVNGNEFHSPNGGRLTEFLIGGPLLATLSTTHDGATSPLISVPIPKDSAFVCFPWAAQATVGGGGFLDLSTSVFGVTGTE